MVNNYNMQKVNEKVPNIKTWLGLEDLRFVQTANNEEKKNVEQALDYLRY